jgi:hypothetical protein
MTRIDKKSTNMQAKTIDEVIERLDVIIDDAKKKNSRIGYFPALYRKVTIQVKEGIKKGDYFENNLRMNDLDVLFANRYLTAYDQFVQNEKTTESWNIAFEKTKHYWPIVLQHLLWGMNAHINLDLGIAAARVAPGNAIHGLKDDFDKINALLASLVEGVEEELSKVWPTLKIILKFSGKIDDFLINFSMKVARREAWKFAVELADKSPEEQAKLIAEKDQEIAQFAKLINPPGLIPKLIFGIIRVGEKRNVAEIIEILE